MLCSPPPATTLASSCAGSQGFCAPCYRRSSQRSRIHNRPKTGRTLLLHERLERFRTPTPLVAATPLPAGNMNESLTVAMPPPPDSTPLVPTREIFTRSAAREAPLTVDAILMPAPPIL